MFEIARLVTPSDEPRSTWTRKNSTLATHRLNATPDVLAHYDLSLVLSSTTVRPNGKVLIPLTVNTAQYDTVKVFYIAEDGSIAECVTTVNANETITFEGDHFSKYAVIGTKTPATDTTPDTNAPDTEVVKKNGIPVGVVIAIVIGSIPVLGVGGFAIFWFVIKKKTWADLIGKKSAEEALSEEAPAEETQIEEMSTEEEVFVEEETTEDEKVCDVDPDEVENNTDSE